MVIYRFINRSFFNQIRFGRSAFLNRSAWILSFYEHFRRYINGVYWMSDDCSNNRSSFFLEIALSDVLPRLINPCSCSIVSNLMKIFSFDFLSSFLHINWIFWGSFTFHCSWHSSFIFNAKEFDWLSEGKRGRETCESFLSSASPPLLENQTIFIIRRGWSMRFIVSSIISFFLFLFLCWSV